VLAITNFGGAAQGIAATTLRALIGDIPLDDVLAQRERTNAELRRKLDDVTERWGVKVTAVEIREIVPPREVQDAMNRQMSAERTRRAAVTEAEGKRQATITVAEPAGRRATVSNPARRGRETGRNPEGGGARPGTRDRLRRCPTDRRKDHDAAGYRRIEGDRREPIEYVCDSDGVHTTAQSSGRLSGPQFGTRPSGPFR
jgi:hypothetical protein